MKLVPLLIGAVALAAVAYGGYALFGADAKSPQKPASAPAGPPQPGQPRGPGQTTVPPAPVIVILSRTAAVPVTLTVIGNVQA